MKSQLSIVAPADQTATPAAMLRVVALTKDFAGKPAVDHVDLDVRNGEFLTIVGPSGCGKTTMLRMLAGLEEPTSGDILLHGQRINDLPPNKRPTCMVFQSLALFPHKSVGENIAFPLKVRGVEPVIRNARALELMKLMRLPADYFSRNVMKCSGGERQRIALARAFAYDPEILFFDEPLSALDYKLKKTLEKELKDIHKEAGKTFVYITHSLEEAMVMSDRIAVMNAGKIVQIGSPDDIYNHPVNRFVAEFMGEVNVFPVRRRAGDVYEGTEMPGSFKVAGAKAAEGYIVVRPESMRLLPKGEAADNVLEAKLYNSYSLGSRMQYRLTAGSKALIVEGPRSGETSDGMVQVGWNAADALFVTD